MKVFFIICQLHGINLRCILVYKVHIHMHCPNFTSEIFSLILTLIYLLINHTSFLNCVHLCMNSTQQLQNHGIFTLLNWSLVNRVHVYEIHYVHKSIENIDMWKETPLDLKMYYYTAGDHKLNFMSFSLFFFSSEGEKNIE